MSTRRRILRAALIFAVTFSVPFVIVLIQAWPAFGGRPDAEARARMEKSPQWHDGAFENPQPLHNEIWGSIKFLFESNPNLRPVDGAVSVVKTDPKLFETPPPTGLRVTWLGHATSLIED